MMNAFALLFLAMPIIEIALFVVIGGKIGLLATLGWIILMALAGSMVVRLQGIASLRKINLAINRGETPAGEVTDGALIVLAGILMVIPGFATDAIAFLILLPPVRSLIRSRLRLSERSRFSFRYGGARQRRPEEDVVDLDAEDFSRQDQNPPADRGRIGKDREPGL